MRISAAGKIEQRTPADILVIPFWKGKKGPELAVTEIGNVKKEIALSLPPDDFKGKEEEISLVYAQWAAPREAYPPSRTWRCRKGHCRASRRAYAPQQSCH